MAGSVHLSRLPFRSPITFHCDNSGGIVQRVRTRNPFNELFADPAQYPSSTSIGAQILNPAFVCLKIEMRSRNFPACPNRPPLVAGIAREFLNAWTDGRSAARIRTHRTCGKPYVLTRSSKLNRNLSCLLTNHAAHGGETENCSLKSTRDPVGQVRVLTHWQALEQPGSAISAIFASKCNLSVNQNHVENFEVRNICVRK